MPKVAFVERKIASVEGFEVRIHFAGPANTRGRDVRSDKDDLPTYSYRRMMKGDATVADWVQTRFNATYAGYSVAVLDGSGVEVHGRTKLSNLRATY